MRSWRGAVLVAAAGLALLSGCGGGNSGGGSNAAALPADGPAKEAAQPPAYSAPGGTDTSSSGTGGGSSTPQGAPVVNTRALIRTATLTVAVDDVTRQAQRAEQIAADNDGELFSDQRSSGVSADQRTADLVLKVPPNSLGTVLDRLAALGTEEDRHTTTDDVTEQVADVDSRVNSAKSSLARLRALYARAQTVGEIAALEGQITQRESDLESLQARQRVLAAQTAMATLTLHLHGRALAPVVTNQGTHPTGFVSALKAGWHAFAVSVQWVVTVLGAVLPFALLLALLAYAAYRYDRARRARTTPAATPAPATPPAT